VAPTPELESLAEGGGETSDFRERIADVLVTLQGFATGDFCRTATVGPAGDEVDALAAGINILGEELQASQDELEGRVAERTEQLIRLTRSLETEVAERKRAEAALNRTNDELTRWVHQLERLNQEVAQLSELSSLFQACSTRQEAFRVLGDLGPKLFVGTDGVVFTFVPSRDVLELATSWGAATDRTQTMVRSACWALRRGRPHRASTGGLLCEHTPNGWTGETLCIPFMAQGDTLGLLQLRWTPAVGGEGSIEPIGQGYERLATGAGEHIALALANLDLRAALQRQSIREPLTGLYNRRYLDETLARELRRADRESSPVSFLMVDIDQFKAFNDRYGHGAGDAGLRQVAELLLEGVRGEDVVCRYGGEEFAVVLCGVRADDALDRAERIRSRVAETELHWHQQGLTSVTVSIGVATYPVHARSSDKLMRAADAALYQAKRTGRNRVVVSGQHEPHSSS
jgi:diguanylate cyclase (GGDEF)-like protein